MIGKLQRYGLPFSNVVATGTATAPITPGRTIEKISLALGGTIFTKAMITMVRLKANGKTFYEATGAQIDKIMAFRGVVASAAFLDIDFCEFKAAQPIDRVVGAFDTSIGISNITAEVTITGATAPTLKMIISESNRQVINGQIAGHATYMSKVLRYPISIANGGTLPVTLPFGPQSGAIIKRVHFETTGGLMTGLTVKQDGLVIHESIAAENSFEQTRRGLVPQASTYTADFVIDREMDKALDTRDARSMEWLLTFSAADNGYVLVEYLDTLGNL